MKTAKTLALFLVLAVLGHSMASIMVRREAEDATSPEADATVNETEGTGAEESTDTEASAAETGATEEEVKETGATEEEVKETGATEEEVKETGEAEDEEETTDEGISDEDDEGTFPDIGFQTGIVFGSPFVTLRQMQTYFFELERALHRVFENTIKEAALHPESNKTSSEEVTVGGHKYLVNRTVIKGGDDDSSVVIKAISIVPTEERRKRAVFDLV